MKPGAGLEAPNRGSILLPVIIVLLLIASAATAMTLQMRTSLREAALRRDRMRLGFLADGVARSTAQALGTALASHRAPPFALDGTPQACAMAGGGRIQLTVQDQSGLVDLNKGRRDLLLLMLERAGLSGWDAKAMSDAIVQRREGSASSSLAPSDRSRPSKNRPARPFASVDEIESLPGMTPAVFDRLQPIFTVGNGSSTIDPTVAGPAIRAVISPKELSGPATASMVGTSPQSAYVLTATVVSASGMRAKRQAAVKPDPSTSAVQFKSWESPISVEPLLDAAPNAFCRVIAQMVGPG